MRTYTHPDVLTKGVREGWADPETNPANIDWAGRQARALVPYKVVEGRPRKPGAPTGIERGRNELGRWGEQAAADAIVTVWRDGVRYLLMIVRGDGYGGAVPGGCVEPDEDPVHAAFRECMEETCLDLTDVLASGAWRALPARVVDDPRASDEAWMSTLPVLIDLGPLPPGAPFPAVAGADDAKHAAWVRADSYAVLAESLRDTFGERVFAAHEEMLAELLG
ncbi:MULTISPECIES: NUDIX domain-containing protein [unclassified Nonomuraea]|uniref:NUDIX domain-containing protein n=1 Tax=unclassified Nonomuraea TaxID=2593643 RepID=UPI00340D8D01